jgi:hypothetical protein
MDDIWKRIIGLEEFVSDVNKFIDGTIIQRTVDGWALALGPLGMPKSIFYGKTIEDCILQAEKQYYT